MSKRLPSLTALRTFEAAARHASFAKAAGELFVTPAAVGFQIKQLEEELGGTLFLRKHRAVELTDRGRELSESIGPAFRTIQKAWDAAHKPMQQKVLKVSGPARAVHSWVLPAVSGINKTSELLISWDLSKEIRDVATGEVDMAIRWAKEPTDDAHWEPLLRTWFTPLVRPDVARYIKRPSDLSECGMIGVDFKLDADATESTWSVWHRLNDLEPPDQFIVKCADTASAVETALATGHATIAGSFLARSQLLKGELVAPFGMAIAPFSRFWLVCRRGLETTQEYQWFLNKVQDSAAAINTGAEDIRVVHPDGSLASL